MMVERGSSYNNNIACVLHYQAIAIKLYKLLIINRPAITNYVNRFELMPPARKRQTTTTRGSALRPDPTAYIT